MKNILRYGAVGLLLVSGYAAAAKEVSVGGYAGIGASRFTFEEEGFPDVEPLSVALFTGLELHRFLDVQVQLSLPVKEDEYSENMSLSLHDYIGRSADISSTKPASVKTDIPLAAAFFIKPKVDVGPIQLYLLGGVTYTKMEQQINGNFDGVLSDSTGVLTTFSNDPFEVQLERESVELSYGAGVAVNLGRLRLHGEYVRIDKNNATNHSCHTTGYVDTKMVVYCDDLFNESVLDTATVGVAINF